MSYVGDRGEISAVHVPGGHAPMVVIGFTSFDVGS
jgi:hypothetical protein